MTIICNRVMLIVIECNKRLGLMNNVYTLENEEFCMMKRNAAVFIFLMMCTSRMYSQPINYDVAVRNIVTQIIRAIDDDEIIAIIHFDSTSDQFSTRIIDDITRDLINDGIRIVERQRLEAVLQEQDFQLSGNVSDSSVQSIGNMLGASSVIIGHGENMADHYRINFRVLSVETAQIRRQIAQDIRFNANMRRLLAGEATSDNIGSTKLYIGGVLGLGIGLHSINSEFYDNYYTGGGIQPKEESGVGFPLSLFIGYQINDHWALQSGLDFFFNNYVKATVTGGYIFEGDYNSLSIPILARYTILFSPVTLNAIAGFHLSFAMGKLNIEGGGFGFSVAESSPANNVTIGMDLGVNAGYKLGPGNIIWGMYFTFDFYPIRGNVDNMDAKIATRRALNIMIGYEYKL